MTFRWISGFSSRAQLRCFLIKCGNLTTRFCAFGVLACLNATHGLSAGLCSFCYVYRQGDSET